MGLTKKLQRITFIIIIFLSLFMMSSCKFVDSENQELSKAIEMLKGSLSNPDSLIIYEVYVNNDYDEDHAALIYFGSHDWLNDKLDDWVLISGLIMQFYSDYERAIIKNDNADILDNASVAWALMRVEIGAEEWVKIEVK